MKSKNHVRTVSGKPSATSGGILGYWAQYHNATCSGSWAFNNETLEFITTQDHSYIGMIFWGSPNSSSTPPFPVTSPTA